MTPKLVAPPVGPVVPLPDLKAHLRVDHNADDALIVSLEAAAMGHLDALTGILGRAILPQTWAVYLPAGCHALPMPDVTAATVDGDPITVKPGPLGPLVELDEAATVQFTCAMPAHLLERARVAVKLLVAEWYERREAGSAELGPAFHAVVGGMRCLRV